MATNPAHSLEADLAVITNWLQADSATVMQGVESTLTPETVTAAVANVDAFAETAAVDPTTAAVGSAASVKEGPLPPSVPRSIGDIDYTTTGGPSGVSHDESDASDESYESEDCNCVECTEPSKKRVRRSIHDSPTPESKLILHFMNLNWPYLN